MVTRFGVQGAGSGQDWRVRAVLRWGRFLGLWVRGAYQRRLRKAAFPRDTPVCVIDGVAPDRLLFVGSIAVSGLGVPRHDMTAGSLVAAQVAASRGRGCVWTEVTAPDLTAWQAGALPRPYPAADAVVVFLGVTDTLVLTPPRVWAAHLLNLVQKIRRDISPDCPIVFAGLPPIADFLSRGRFVRTIVATQACRLNMETEDVTGTIRGCYFAPFPAQHAAWDDDGFWERIHADWATAVTPSVVRALTN